jgi:hypothetical protein
MSYKATQSIQDPMFPGGESGSGCVIRISDGACIPPSPSNRDYIEYLEWLEAGNELLPADS